MKKMKYTSNHILEMDRSTFYNKFNGAIVDIEQKDGSIIMGKVEEIGITHDCIPVDIIINGRKIDILQIKEIRIVR